MVNEKVKSINGILLIYHHPPSANAPTIMEHVNAFGRHSRFKVWSVNTELGFPKILSETRFGIIVLHYSLFGPWHGPRPFFMSEEFRSYMDLCRTSYKIAFFQDEHHYCQQRFDFLNLHQIDCVYTLIEPNHFKDVYQKYTDVSKLVYHIPGYVSDDLIEIARQKTLSDEERTVDVGYRARPLPFYMGRGAQEKTGVAIGFRERAKGLGLRLDIETDEYKRIYGKDWYQFVANCRGMIGTEAGASITDTDGQVRAECERLLALNPRMTFAEMSEAFLHRWENNIPQRVISPRHFEAAAFRVCQILFEGKYSGAMQPMVHYIPLKKDFSNFDDCIRIFQDKAWRDKLTENAYRDLIASGRYSYQKFIAEFDNGVLEAGLQTGVAVEEAARITARLNREQFFLELRARRTVLLYHTAFPGRRALAFIGGPPLRLLRRLKQMTSNRTPNSYSKKRT